MGVLFEIYFVHTNWYYILAYDYWCTGLLADKVYVSGVNKKATKQEIEEVHFLPIMKRKLFHPILKSLGGLIFSFVILDSFAHDVWL